MSGTFNFDTTILEDAPQSLDLRLEVAVILSAMPPITATPDAAGNPGGTMAAPDGEPVGPFIFDFTVPFIPAIVLMPETVVEANGLPMTLEQVSITPSMTRTHLCFTPPDNAPDWLPMVVLDIGEARVEPLSSLGIAPTTATVGESRCVTLDFPAPYDLHAAQWTLRVERLQRAGQDSGGLAAPGNSRWTFRRRDAGRSPKNQTCWQTGSKRPTA